MLLTLLLLLQGCGSGGTSTKKINPEERVLKDPRFAKMFGLDPNSIDTNGDGFDDLFEFEHIVDGYDPTQYTKIKDPWDYAVEYSNGFMFGDFACEDYYSGESIPCVLGSISSGFVVYGSTTFVKILEYVYKDSIDILKRHNLSDESIHLFAKGGKERKTKSYKSYQKTDRKR